MRNKAQSTLEYAFVIIASAAALLAIAVYVKRGVEGRLRRDAEQLSSSAYSLRATTGIYTMTSTVHETSDHRPEKPGDYEDKTSISTSTMHLETGVSKDETILPFSAEPERN